MEKSKTAKEKQEKLLLDFIDIPYFRNNPAYIDKWRTYYYKYKDPQILFLMYHKQISTYFHWIYIELASVFLKINKPEISHFILTEALRLKVYDENKIKDFLNKIPNFEKKYTKGELLAVLNQKNINALGRKWNSFEEEFYYKNLPSEYCNFEIMLLIENEKKYCQNVIFDLKNNINVKEKIDEINKLDMDNEEINGEKNNVYLNVENNNITNLNNVILQQVSNNENLLNVKVDEISSHMNNYDSVLEENDNSQVEMVTDTTKVNVDPEININNELYDQADYDKIVNSSTLSDSIIKNCNFEAVLNKDLQLENKSFIDENASFIKSPNKRKSIIFENHQENNNNILEKRNNDNFENKIFDKKVKINEKSTFNNIFNNNFYEIQGVLDIGNEIIINKCIYTVRNIQDGGYSLLSIAKDSDKTETMVGKLFMLKPAKRENVILAKKIFDSQCCELEDKTFVLFEHNSILHLSSIIKYLNENIGYFYLKQIINCILLLMENDILIEDLDFLVNEDFKLILNTFDFIKLNNENFVLITKKLKNYFGFDDIEISYDYISKIDKVLNESKCKKEILKHKTNILQSI